MIDAQSFETVFGRKELEKELFDKFIKQLGIKENEYGHYCFVEEGIDAAYEQFENIQLGAIDIILCPDKSLISRKFTNICIIIKIFEMLLMYYSFACVPISNNPFLNGFEDTSISSGYTTYSPLSIILIFAFVYYVLLTLQTGVRNSMLMVTTKDFTPQKNWTGSDTFEISIKDDDGVIIKQDIAIIINSDFDKERRKNLYGF